MSISKEHIKIAKASKSSFLSSFIFLSKEKNDAINTIYAFCRKTDDIVDDENLSDEIKQKNLSEWKDEFELSLIGKSKHRLLNRLNSVIHKFKIPVEPFYQLIEGMKMDLTGKRYQTFEELYEYCYRAASTVGLICIEIFGYNNIKTKEYAVNLGVALQLTNILRDLKKDATGGRIYLPLEDLHKFGYTEPDLISNKYNDAFIELMKFECKRARYYYEKANSYLEKEDKGLMFPARIMEHIYSRILQKIEDKNYNVFTRITKVSKFRKIYVTLGVFLKYRLFYSFKDPRIIPAN